MYVPVCEFGCVKTRERGRVLAETPERARGRAPKAPRARLGLCVRMRVHMHRRICWPNESFYTAKLILKQNRGAANKKHTTTAVRSVRRSSYLNGSC